MINKPASVQLFNISEIRTCYMPRKNPGFFVRNKVRSLLKGKNPQTETNNKEKQESDKITNAQLTTVLYLYH